MDFDQVAVNGMNSNDFIKILLKGRDAKPEGTKVRKPDHVSRLPLFPYVEKM